LYANKGCKMRGFSVALHADFYSMKCLLSSTKFNREDATCVK
jgi:hypothetical protein